jgi:Flp pilus assembly protein TadD
VKHHDLADTLTTLGRAYAQLGRADSARRALGRAIEILQTMPEPDSAGIAALRGERAAIDTMDGLDEPNVPSGP